MPSTAGYKFLAKLNSIATTSEFWDAEDYWNVESEDNGKINMHHLDTGGDFYVTRAFDSEQDEMVYVQPLSTIYSSFGLLGTTNTDLIADESIACSYLSRPWLEDGTIQGRGISEIYMTEGCCAIVWCAQVGQSNSPPRGISSLGIFGITDEYHYAGGLPYDAENEKPLTLKNHFFTKDGSLALASEDGETHIFTAHSMEDMQPANPFIKDSEIEFRLLRIYVTDLEEYVGSLPNISWISSSRVTLEPSDALILSLPEEITGRAFQDGNRLERWIVLHDPELI